jgi:hypothetical protein
MDRVPMMVVLVAHQLVTAELFKQGKGIRDRLVWYEFTAPI